MVVDLKPGTVVERYIIEGILGEGGMSVVFRARHRDLGSQHAIKQLMVGGRRIEERLLSEGRAQSDLRHPNVVRVTDLVSIDGAPALVMEYVHGPSLASLLRRFRPNLKECDALARDILSGVAAAHAYGVMHRDLKPANILISITEDGLVPKIADFGLLKVIAGPELDQEDTKTGAQMGTPGYMAPEQIQDSSAVDARADVFSLGAILYELVTGEKCFGKGSAFDVWQRIRNGDYRPLSNFALDIPPRIQKAIEGALRVDPGERIPDVKSLLEMWCTGEDGEFVTVVEQSRSSFWSTEIRDASETLIVEHGTSLPSYPDSGGTQKWVHGPTDFTEVVENYEDSEWESVSASVPMHRRSRGRWISLILLVVLCTGIGVWLLSGPNRGDSRDAFGEQRAGLTEADLSTSAFRLQSPVGSKDQQNFELAQEALLAADFSSADGILRSLMETHREEPALVALVGVTQAYQDLLGQFVVSSQRANVLARDLESPLSEALELAARSVQERDDRSLFQRWLEMRSERNDPMLDVLFLTHSAIFTPAEPKRALDEIDTIIDAHPDWALPVVAKLKFLMWSGDEGAINYANSAIQDFPGVVYLRFLLGRIQLGLDNLEAAEGLFVEVLTQEPRLIAARLHLAQVYLEKGDEEARLTQKEVLLGPTIPGEYRGNFMLRHGMALASRGQLTEAESLWESCVDEGQGIEDLALGIQCIHLGLRNAIALKPPEAWEAWRQKLQAALLQPELGDYLRQMYVMKDLQAQAEYALQMGRLEVAESILDRLQGLDNTGITQQDRQMAIQGISFLVYRARKDAPALNRILLDLETRDAQDRAESTCHTLNKIVQASQVTGDQERGQDALERLATGACLEGRLGKVLQAKALVLLAKRLWTGGDLVGTQKSLERLGEIWPNADRTLGPVQHVAELQAVLRDAQ